jgi:class 3 adenylate cyclase
MAGSRRNRVPRFYGLRIYLSTVVIYYWLVLPFFVILSFKYSPELKLRNQDGYVRFEVNDPESADSIKNNSIQPSQITDSLILAEIEFATQDLPDSIKNKLPDEIPQQIQLETPGQTGQEKEETRQIIRALFFLFNLLLISFFLGFIFNFPFKRYFARKRKNKRISEGLNKFCKKYLLKVPVINAGILGISILVAHIFMGWILFSKDNFDNEVDRRLFMHMFYISIIASVLSLLFLYYWEKHRVHIRYIEHIFDKEELKRRIFNIRVGRIRNRMWVSAAMTTLLPLTLVIFYLFLNVTKLNELSIGTFNNDQKQILYGDYLVYTEQFSGSETEVSIQNLARRFLFYINAINSLLMFGGISTSILIAFVYILFIVKWTTQDIVYPVKELLENMRETGKGKMHNFGIVRTNDEIGELTEGYNDMTHKLSEYIQSISSMTEAYSRFVPRQFLDFLGKESFVDIKLGDQVEKEMTVLFSDIRAFTELSEQMTPKENFDFLNYYLGYMEPLIRNNNGFIDKYIGDSIMALFSDSPEDAINASIEMRIKLSQFNQVMDQFGKPSINSGIGIHSGKLMLGVVGGEGRMDGTVISDAVNLAARLEGLTKLYGSSIIISQDTLISLSNPSLYHYRFLDIVKVKGKKEAVYVFEIIDGDPEDIKQLKLKTKEQYAAAINAYKQQKFGEAHRLFKAVYEVNGEDKASELYINRCDNFIKHGVPEGWDGIQTIRWN